METGAITGHIDVAQVVLYAFWLFFAGLIFYLCRENRREGFPLVTTDRTGKVSVFGNALSQAPRPKSFLTADGTVILAPSPQQRPEPASRYARTGKGEGMPVVPVGEKLTAGVGPGAWANRHDVVELAFDDAKPKLVPLRTAPEFFLATEDPTLIGFEVLGADGLVAGKVVDAWIDRSEVVLRYVEVELGLGEAGRRVLLPTQFMSIDRRAGRVACGYIRASQFSLAPATKHPEQVTLLEEDQIQAFYAAGSLYAWPGRDEPVL